MIAPAYSTTDIDMNVVRELPTAMAPINDGEIRLTILHHFMITQDAKSTTVTCCYIGAVSLGHLRMSVSRLDSMPFRSMVYGIALVFVLTAGLFASHFGARWDYGLVLPVCLTVVAMLMAALAIDRFTSLHLLADIARNLALVILLMFVGAALALLVIRTPAAVADGWLAQIDGMLPVSAVEVVKSVNHWPNWSIRLLHSVYAQTGLYLALSLIAWHLLGRADHAWRLFLIWAAGLFTTTMLALVAPALGCFVFLNPADVSALPLGAGRYAMDAFNTFRHSQAPLLSAENIAGVTTFPSFHTLCALLLAQAWHGVRLLGPATKAMSALIIFSCMPMGGHYIVDLVAGAAVWFGVATAVRKVPEWATLTIGRDGRALIPA